jgi:hypothetical protein
LGTKIFAFLLLSEGIDPKKIFFFVFWQPVFKISGSAIGRRGTFALS